MRSGCSNGVLPALAEVLGGLDPPQDSSRTLRGHLTADEPGDRPEHETLAVVDGLNGTTAPVAAIWIVEGDHPPRLVSTWVDIP